MAKRDYYQVLGVAKTAPADEIRKAYRKLARQYHPDVNKSADAQKRFTEVQEAYDVLSDEQKRKMYDQMGHADFRSAASGGGGAGAPHYTWSNVGGGGRGSRPDIDAEDLGSMFEAFFGGRGGEFGGIGGMGGMGGVRGRAGRRGGRAAREPEAPPAEHELEIGFMTAVRGGTERLRIEADGRTRTIEVTIPKGITDGARLRVKGGAGVGDIILKIRVGEHPLFRRSESRAPAAQGLDLYLDLPLTIAEATLGAEVSVPTLDGTLEMTIPPGTASGRKLRLRGRGIEDAKGVKGDLYAIVKIVPPDGRELPPQEAAALRTIAERSPNPRAGQDWPDRSGRRGA